MERPKRRKHKDNPYKLSYGNNNESDDDTSVNVNINQADISSEEDAQ